MMILNYQLKIISIYLTMKSFISTVKKGVFVDGKKRIMVKFLYRQENNKEGVTL